MNIYQKFIQFHYWYKNGLKRQAWQVLLQPFTKFEQSAIAILLAIGFVAAFLAYSGNVKAELVQAYQAQQINALQTLKLQKLVTSKEEIIVSMLNGSVKVDGKIKTLCVITAAGLCE